METRVELRLNAKINSSIIKEVRELSKPNTSDKKKIKVIADKIDDHLLIIRFNSYSGKSYEIAGSIMKSYSLYLDSYSDISVYFKTRRNDLTKSTDNLSKRDIKKKVNQFILTLNTKNWELLKKCLTQHVEISFSKETNLKRKYIKNITISKFKSDIEQYFKDNKTKYKICKYEFEKKGAIICKINYHNQIQKHTEIKQQYQVYELEMIMVEKELKISKITYTLRL